MPNPNSSKWVRNVTATANGASLCIYKGVSLKGCGLYQVLARENTGCSAGADGCPLSLDRLGNFLAQTITGSL